MRRAAFFTFLLVFSVASLAGPSWAQTYTATQPDNTLTPADPIGIPPQPTRAGTHESVSTINGGLSFFLPVLSLPQRGGWNLTLGYHNTSPNWSARQDVSVTVPNDGSCGGPKATYMTYNDNLQPYPATGPLTINLPTLQASVEYTGNAQYMAGNSCFEVPVICLTNWIFTDWSGNRHPFTNVPTCNVTLLPSPATFRAQVTDSSDGSWLRLDTSNYSTSITVRTKDGTTYTFPGFSTPWPTPCGPSIQCNINGSTSTTTYGNPWYSQTFTSMVDSTGQNSVSYSSNGTLTDTIGRQITIGGGITYKDANGNPQTIQVTRTQQTAQTYNLGTFSCNVEGNIPPNVFPTVSNGPSSFTLNPSTYTVTLPAVNSVSRIYTLQLDGFSNLLQVTYPPGGYTKFDYQSTTYFQTQNLIQCQQPQQQVAHKRECPLSSGACSSSQELVTTYTPSPDAAAPFNDSISVMDALGDVTSVQNQNLAGAGNQVFVAPHETDRYIYPPGATGGAWLRHIQTAYTPYVASVDIQVPSSVTTTLNDISPAISSITNYQYQTVSMKFHCSSSCQDHSVTPATVDIDNPTEIDEYDYGNTTTPTKKTAQTWMTTSNGSLYDIAGGHLLDRLSSRTITDPATSVQSTLGYGYDSVGDVTSKTVGGTSLTSLTTNYQRDTYGNITQATDPKGNITHFGYADTWAQATCAPGSNSSAYLTSMTDALNHITNFSYNSCTGSKASATDANNKTISFSYDALGRPTQANPPDGGQSTTTYVDLTPNSITVSRLINSTSNLQLQTKTILDGFSRTIQTQLLSDPDGVTYTDTTYDNLGRVATVSNPYRTSNDAGPTNGTTSTFYDALNRTCVVVPPDGTLPSGGVCPTTQPANTVFTTYSGNLTTVTDQAGKSRKSQTDALGRLTKVWEDPTGLNYETDYGYDAFGNLKSVVQNGSRQRNFVYDALSRLTSATNPESGTIAYAYDADSNVVTKTSPAPNQTGTVTVSTAYSYDALNRLTGKTYSDGTLPVAYFFDGQTPPATNSSGTGTVTINGSEQSTAATYGSGTISISRVTSSQQSVSLGSSYTCHLTLATSTPASAAASSVASCLNNSGLVQATTGRSSTVTVTALTAGTTGNYPLSWSGFSGTLTGMSGGSNGTPDSGTVSVTVNGFQQSVSYGSGSSGTSIASALVTAFNGNQSSPVTATSSSNVLTLTAKATGSTSNYSLSASDTYNTSLFSNPSFTPAAFGFSLTGGCNADSITVTNGIYRRTGMCDAAGAEAWTYDSMGRVLTDQRNTNGINKTASYAYDVGGDITTLTYPSGRVITYTLSSSGTNTAARLASAVDSAYSLNYATAAHYSPAGALASLTNNTTIASTFLFNSRLQPCWVYATTGTPLPWNSTNCTSTAATGSLLDLKYNFNLGVGDNGNVMGITNNIGPDRSQSFAYDSLNRISTAQTNGTFATSPSNCWAETYTYDAWANLLKLGPNSSTQSAYTGCSQESGFDYTNFTSTNNQITYTGFSYDAAGNLTTPPGAGTVTYNAENQTISAGGANYLYDGDGRRVQKSNGTMYWYGMSGDALDETDLTGSFTNSSFHEYISFNGAHVARRDSSNNVQYYFEDHLGSARIVANSSGSPLDNSDFYPYGGERQISSSSGNRYKFTGKERDTESSLDDFGARYYSSLLGRFISTDWSAIPVPVPYANLTNPQSLNLYAIVHDNPETFVDLDGHDGSGGSGAIPGAKCKSVLCRLLSVLFGGSKTKTVPGPPNRPEIMFVYNTLAGGHNFAKQLAYVLTGKEKLLRNEMPYMQPMTKEDADALRGIELALIFIPEADVEVLAEEGLEVHHLLPREFREIFEEAGLDIEEFTIKIRTSKHRLKRGPGLHTIKGGNWNKVWERFLRDPANRTAPRILEQLDKMILENFWHGAA